jgi:chromosome partitioning protein
VIIALTGQKGGSGKTTLAVCLAAYSVELGIKTLLIDSDAQASAGTWMSVADENDEQTNGGLRKGLAVLDGGRLHKEVASRFPKMSSPGTCIIDCPPRNGEIVRAALVTADVALIPVVPSPLDAWALAEMMETVAQAREAVPRLRVHVVINRVQSRSSLGRELRDALTRKGIPVLATEIHQRVSYPYAMSLGRGVTSHRKNAPAAQEIRSLWEEIHTQAKRKK